MKFKIQVKQIGNSSRSSSWWEEYEKDTDDPHKWAKETLESFNASLRPGESARELLNVEIVEGNNDALHNWDKDVKAMSAEFRGRMYDGMYCTKCGITGKRFGLSPRVTIDSKFRKKVFRRCDTSIVEMRSA